MPNPRGRPPQTHCKRGHSLDDAYILGSGSRSCRVCARERQTEYNRVRGLKPRPSPKIDKTPIVLAYAAGIIDGEGSVMIRLLKKKGHTVARYHNLVVCVSSTDYPLCEWMQAHFGGTISTPSRPTNNWKAAWKWQLLSRHAEEFLRAVRPYLVIKDRHADIGLALRESTTSVGRAHKIPDELIAYRESLRQQLRALTSRTTPIEEP